MADGSGFTTHDRASEPGAPQPPNMGFLDRTRLPAPQMPLQAFGPWWAKWIGHAAEGANAPPDYTALPLLAAASALIGNSRWACAWAGWTEPSVLWCASVGDPSSSKSSGAAPIMRDVLGRVERHMARNHEAALSKWQEDAKVADTFGKQWEREVVAAVKSGDERPEKPPEATGRPAPIRPRASVSDCTVEALAGLMVGLPKGLLHRRDELAGWLMNLSRYSGGSDRPFWLEAYVGGPYTVDRKGSPEPLFIHRLAVATFGTIQPDRLEDCLTGADDGLAGRFLWTWPEPKPFRRPAHSGDAAAAAQRLQRLADLTMIQGQGGDVGPSYLSLDPAACDLMERFGQEMQAAEVDARGPLKTSVGKARGQALRLALVLTYLRWCGDGDGMEPVCIGADAMAAAMNLMRDYFLPMAARVLGDASVPTEERNARTLAEWIMRERPPLVNVSSIRDGARLPGLRESEPVKQACAFLAEAGWLTRVDAPTGGRPRGDWLVNPLLWDALDASAAPASTAIAVPWGGSPSAPFPKRGGEAARPRPTMPPPQSMSEVFDDVVNA